MKRVISDDKWSLMCPGKCPGLSDCYGEEFEKLYVTYENEKRYAKQIAARDLWIKILETINETGNPYILYKDHCNRKSNQKNLGTIKSSNLCVEIMQYTSAEDTAVCNLASIALNKFVDKCCPETKQQQPEFDFKKLGQVVEVLVENLNKVIDNSHYPDEKAAKTSKKYRPIGIGVQGLADTFLLMDFEQFDCEKSRQLNKNIFETIYFHALKKSMELCKQGIFPRYNSFESSPSASGILQFDLWEPSSSSSSSSSFITDDDWIELKENIKKYGLCNSLVTALMPTATSAQILGNSESVEPYINNMFVKKTEASEFRIINPHLMNNLCTFIDFGDSSGGGGDKELIIKEIGDKIVDNKGYLNDIQEIPDVIKKKFKTIWQISNESLLEMAADRGRYVDQSQSTNIYKNTTLNNRDLTNLLINGWKMGLKTGMYYLRSEIGKNNEKDKKWSDEKTILCCRNKNKDNMKNNNDEEEEGCLVNCSC
ncbi:ribonucleoside-diphosphate reductase large subunit-like [Brevipalpus obovatus]|uniref:ribonucleoside-diphosphate reductase large subunit-like n=1 Tax=Brevipalpus obovatus TaxID=246614 RepID=UPI003D9E7908